MNKPSLRIVNNSNNHITEIHIYGVIGDYWWSDDPVSAREFQKQLNLAESPEVHVHINSPGGDVHEGLAICNAIKASKKIVKTFNDGICASMAAVILASAPEGRRFAAKSSLTMIHSASTFAWGNAAELRDTADSLEKHDTVLAETIADAMGKTAKEIQDTYFNGKDHWLTANECSELNLVEVLDYAIEEIPENPTAMQYNQVAAYYKPKNINNKDMGLFNNNNFKKVAALAKTPIADVTEEQLDAANEELKSEGLEGFEIVKTENVSDTIAEANKVPGLEKKVQDLEAQAKLDQKTISDLKAENSKPAEESTAPVKETSDSTAGDNKPVVNEYETSVDREAAQYR